MRFRRHHKAFTADVEIMFHQFLVPLEDSTYTRFFWIEDNDPEKDLVQY